MFAYGHQLSCRSKSVILGMDFNEKLVCNIMLFRREIYQVIALITTAQTFGLNMVTFSNSYKNSNSCARNQSIIVKLIVHAKYI